MRLDFFLKLSRLIPKRNLAREFAKAGRIEINGKTAKASSEVRPGDMIKINRHSGIETVSVISTPEVKQLAKKNACELYERQAFEQHDFLGG